MPVDPGKTGADDTGSHILALLQRLGLMQSQPKAAPVKSSGLKRPLPKLDPETDQVQGLQQRMVDLMPEPNQSSPGWLGAMMGGTGKSVHDPNRSPGPGYEWQSTTPPFFPDPNWQGGRWIKKGEQPTIP